MPTTTPLGRSVACTVVAPFAAFRSVSMMEPSFHGEVSHHEAKAFPIRWPGAVRLDKSVVMGTASSTFSPRAAVWSLRVSWPVWAVLTAVAAANRLDGAGGAAASVVGWCMVAVGVVALVVPSTVGLTAMRIVAPAALPLAAVVVAVEPGGIAAAALAMGAVIVVLALSAETGQGFVQASAYGDERRHLLRAPAAVLPFVVLAWSLWCTAVIISIVMLAAAAWVWAVAAGVVAAALTVLLARSFHTLSRRWLVALPAGIVVHDGMALGETLMVPRPNVASAELALAGTEALDLTGPAAGHAIEVAVRQPVLVQLVGTRAEPKARAVHARSFLVAPSRPGLALASLQPATPPPRTSSSAVS